MTFEEIRQLIVAHMAALPDLKQSRVAYPNQINIFTPPDEGLWCRFSIQYATAFMAGMADRPYTRKPGQISIQCFARERTGTRAITELADAIEAHFAYWMSGDLECQEASQVIAGEFEGFYQINVNIRFRAG